MKAFLRTDKHPYTLSHLFIATSCHPKPQQHILHHILRIAVQSG